MEQPDKSEVRVRPLEDFQRAVLNILEDLDGERSRLQEVQRATLNLLEDFDGEKSRLEGVQKGALNILEDFDGERSRLQEVQRAALNLLEDFDAEKLRLQQSQKVLLNILEDFDTEKSRTAAARQDLEATNKELEAFTYSVSHDLRSPLRHISGFANLLMEEYSPRLEADAQRYLRRIQEGTQRMGQLVDDLLNLARIGRQELRQQVTGLNSLVEEARAELRPEAEGRLIEWRVGRLPFVECDPALMKQVFLNLLSNGIKYTRPRERAVIQVDQMAANGHTAIFVRDNGVGFSMKYADKLFGVFQRLHRQEDFEGTGIGLATVQRIIHKHGGRVWAEAELDQGSTFYFTLGATDSRAGNAPVPGRSET